MEPVLYLRVKNALAQLARSGQVKPDQQLPSEFALTRKFHVSRITVRKALAELEKDRLIYRLPGKGTFVARPSRPVLHQLTFHVVCQWDVYREVFYGQLFGGIQQESQRLGCGLHVENPARDVDVPELIEHLNRAPDRDGCLFLGKMNANLLAWACDHKNKTVLVDNVADDRTLAVAGDNVDGAYCVTRHLLDLGHRAILHVTRPSLNRSVSFIRRQAGWEKALREAGITPPAAALLSCPYQLSDAFYADLQRRLTSYKPTAIFCGNDGLAGYVAGHLLRQGVKVPDDISLAGFDDLSSANQLGLTTVAVPIKEMGVAAVRKLVNNIQGTSIEPPVTILPVKLVVRQSTGAVRVETEGDRLKVVRL